jgi:hypothetical protein
MEAKRYRVEVRTRATLVYYVVEYDIDAAISLALDAPYREWEVSEFDMPEYGDVIAEETRL